jgi:hypothetical protein
MPIKTNAPKKAIAKNNANFEYFSFFQMFPCFLLWTFLAAFLKAGINEFEIGIKICVFIPILIFLMQFFGDNKSTFCKL